MRFSRPFALLLASGLLALAALLASAIAGPGARPAYALTNCSVNDLSVDSEEQAFLGLINNYRAQNGAGALTMSANLNRASSWMAADMATKNYFSHTDSLGRTFSTRITDCGGSSPGGENIAAGYDTAASVFTAWQNSPGHNANMLSASFVQIGISRFYNAGSMYGWYWVTDFSIVNDGTSVSGAQLAMSLDAPAAGKVSQPFTVSGWAIDRGATSGPGVDTVTVYAYPADSTGKQTSNTGVSLGNATYGGVRSDVGAAYGAQFTNSGYSLQASGLPTGYYLLAVYAHSSVNGGWTATSRLIQTTSPQSALALSLDAPAAGKVSQPFTVSGWAIDRGAASGPGVDTVMVYAYPADSTGKQTSNTGVSLGNATYGGVRSDVGAAYGSQFTNSGYSLQASGLPTGYYLLAVYAHSTVNGSWAGTSRLIQTTSPQSALALALDAPATGAVSQPFSVSGWAIDRGAASGTGVDTVRVYAYPADSSGKQTSNTGVFFGTAAYGGSRPDVAAAYGSQFTNSAYGLQASGLAPGYYLVAVYAHSTVDGSWIATSRFIHV